jgi:serine phosphatase RsbU (regulator of sigma subunit)
MQIKIWGLFTISKNQFIYIESIFISFFLLLTIFFFSYQFPDYVTDPLVLFHAKYLKYVCLVFTFFMIIETQYYLNKFIRKQLEINQTQTLEIKRQKENITSSIRYASRIQTALLPPDDKIPQNLEHFILFLPKDIVSGDYYWISQKNNRTVFVAADCTGHGVPGAFMSALGIAFLNEIVNLDSEDISAADILNGLKQKITDAFYTGDHVTLDGMDMAICILNDKTAELEYAGAFNPMFVISPLNKQSENTYQDNDRVKILRNYNYELRHYKANRMPIGVSNHTESFRSHRIQLQKNDTIYIFSDGYTEQLGGEKGKRFFTKRFKKYLLSIQNRPMQIQKELLLENFNNWRQPKNAEQFDQLDDILIIGLRLK